MACVRARTYLGRVYSLDIKRCAHCGARLAAVQLDHGGCFDADGPALVCGRCDGTAAEDDSAGTAVPYWWR
jgi:hypothetical protein